MLDGLQPSWERVQMEGPELAWEKEAEKEIMCKIRRKKKKKLERATHTPTTFGAAFLSFCRRRQMPEPCKMWSQGGT